MVSGNGFFRLESDTSRTAAGATLYQWQNNEWVLVGYHSKRLPDAVRNYGVTELESQDSSQIFMDSNKN